jgi:uncharacterized protein with HEPN domain
VTSDRIYLGYLKDILTEIDRVSRFIRGMNYERFSRDEKTQYAVVRSIEIIGEASKNIPEDIRSRYPDIPWRDMATMRNLIVHQYANVNLNVVWQTATQDLPRLKGSVKQAIQGW